jgi:tetratricopeptide (TPR) repeat protein
MIESSAIRTDAAPTLVVIAKNESRCIERCLRSAQPYVAGMLVLDTGSTDGTPELARACGAEVHFFDWIDDFSAARNRALELADAHWSLFLDADEWIDPESSFQWPAKASQAQLGLVRMMNIDQSSGMDLPVSSWLPRLLPRGVRYEGRIHEQPASQLPRVRSGLTVVHDGYLKEQLQKKQGRNRRLLTQALQAEPDDPYLLYQFGTEHEGAKEYAAAADLYRKALALLTVHASYEHSLLVRAIHCLGQAGRIDEALTMIEQWAGRYPHSPDFHFAAGSAYLNKGVSDPAQALQLWLPRAVQSWQRCLEIGDQPELEGSMRGRGSFLAALNLQVVFSQLGDSVQAEFYRGLAQQLKRAGLAVEMGHAP